MFQFKDKDYEIMFEYDDINELEQVLNKIKEIKQIQQKQEQEQLSQATYSLQYNKFTFEELELEFLAHKKKMEVSKASFLAYNSIFSKLKTYFKKQDINNIGYRDYEDFRDTLIRQGLENKTGLM